MRLLAYIPSAGIPEALGDIYVRVMLVADCDIPVGQHEQLDVFKLRLTNADVIEHDGQKFICIKNFDQIRVAVSDFDFLSEEYRKWFGKHAYVPTVDAVIDAHILKDRIPNLALDYDNFVEWLRSQLEALPNLDMSTLTFDTYSLHDSATKGTYDLWDIYRHYLMLDGKMVLAYTPHKEIQINDLHSSEKGISWWIQEHNKNLQILAQQHDMHTIFLCFMEDVRIGADYAYYFVGREGNFAKRPVDAAEFRHMAIHGQFPEIIVEDEGTRLNFKFNYMEFFTEQYHDFNNYARHTHERIRSLMRFI